MTGGAAVVVRAKGITQILEGDYAGGFSNLLDAGSNLFMMSRLKACFVAGTPMMVVGGDKAIETLKDYETFGEACDWVWSRAENDPDGELVPRRMLRRFENVAPVLNLHLRDRIIGTTAEHPFWEKEKGWTNAFELKIGDVVRLADGWTEVLGIADCGQIERVHNCEVEGDHTYFECSKVKPRL